MGDSFQDIILSVGPVMRIVHNVNCYIYIFLNNVIYSIIVHLLTNLTLIVIVTFELSTDCS